MKFLMAVLAVLMLTSFSAAQEVKLLIWSDYIEPAIPQQFEKATGLHVKIDVYEETEAMIAKLQAAGGDSQYDVVVASDHAIPILAKLGLIRKLDLAKIPNVANIDKRFVKPPYDPRGDFSVPYQWGTVGLIYSKKALPNFNASWGAIFDPAKAQSRFLLLDSMRDTLGAALITQGHSINSRSKDELRQAGKLVLDAKQNPKCVGFDGSPSAAKKVVGNQADIAIVYNGDALSAMKDAKDPNIEYAVPKEGSIIWVDTMVIPDKAPNLEGAHKLINYILDAKVGAQLSNYINYASPNAASMKDIDADAHKDPRIYPTEEQMKKLQYLQDVGKDTGLYDEVWTAVKAR